ncbi:MAG TPA: MAE_28990/MAE_18760 family HEPN-like nuclease [Noviherbaspirillum sp.]|nr:MAE_28990/MAE_18760 family HEPN-like nuclease [Noviherbaspirillum sp.]
MFVQPLEGAKRAIAALRASLHFNLALRTGLTSGTVTFPAEFAAHPPYDEWKKLDHSVALSRLYLIYESLVHECVSEWLETLCHFVPYNALPEKVKTTHRDGIGYILQNLEGRRFSTISVPVLVKEYQEALSQNQPYKLHADAFLLHDRNLRVDELQKLIGSCGLELGLSDWLRNHRLFSGDESLQLIGHATVEKAISALVDLRNEVSHATRQVGEIFGEEVLIAYTNFVESLIDAIVEGFTHAAMKWHAEYGAWSAAGKINFVVTDDKHICVAPLTSCKVRSGMTIFMKGKGHCCRTEIVEIRVNDAPVPEYTVVQAQEIGLRLSTAAIKGSEIFIRTDPPAIHRPTNPNEVDLKDSDASDDENTAEEVDEIGQ